MSLSEWSYIGADFSTRQSASDRAAVSLELLRWVLAGLRAQYWSYQEAHWCVMGPSFYGDHLLFQRLYESVTEQVDALAEKMVAAYGPVAVQSSALAPKFEQWLAQWQQVDCLHERGLRSEEAVQSALRRAYDGLKALGTLTLGMDDFLMATASEHETNEYLLKQVLDSKAAATEWAALGET